MQNFLRKQQEGCEENAGNLDSTDDESDVDWME